MPEQFESPRAALSDEALASLSAALAESAERYDRSGDFPHANFRLLADAGLLALTVPVEHGGQGATLAEVRRVIGAVARGEPSTALILTMQYLQQLELHASPRWPAELKRRLARGAIENGELINALRVEPDLGTPLRGGVPATTARRSGDHWVISGVKRYSTGFPGLSWLNVWAASDDPDPLVGFWLIPAGSPGISVTERWDHLGMRATNSHDVRFDEVEVPLDHAVDVRPLSELVPSQGDKTLWLNVLLSTLYDAVARNARDCFRDWLQSRVPTNLGAPLASLPRFQEVLGRIDGLLFSNRVLLEAGERDELDGVEAAQLKRLVCEQAIEAVSIAIEASGNPGLSRRSTLERHYRDVLCARIHSPQADIVLVQAGKAALRR